MENEVGVYIAVKQVGEYLSKVSSRLRPEDKKEYPDKDPGQEDSRQKE